MKFYNPFKPHIVQDGFGVFYVRKLSSWMLMPCWSYMSHSGLFYLPSIIDPEPFPSSEAAKMTFQGIRSRQDEDKRYEKKRNTITFVKTIPGRDEA